MRIEEETSPVPPENVLIPIAHIAEVLAPLLGEPIDSVTAALHKVDVDQKGKLSLGQCKQVIVAYPHMPDLMPLWLQMSNKEAPSAKQNTIQNLSIIEGLIAGGVAGAVSKTVIAPGDRVKILFQVNSVMKFTFPAAVQLGTKIVKEEGVFALWKGNGAMMIRVVPYSSLTYMTNEQYHKVLHSILPEHDKIARFMAGAAAGATATTFTYPLDLMRARLAANPNSLHYESYYSAFHHTLVNEGVRGLYHGLTPTLLGIMPYAGTSFMTYATIKKLLVRAQGKNSEKELPKYQLLMGGGLAGVIAQSATYPLDILRRRMQVRSTEYTSMSSAFRDILAQEGWRAFYKGLSMNWVKGPIAVGVSFTINDSVKHRMRDYHLEEAKAISVAIEEGNIPKLTVLEALAAGGTAGAAAKLWTIPVERLKILYQVSPGRHFTVQKLRKTAKIIIGATGVMGLWRGTGITMMRVVPYAALTYSAYDVTSAYTPRMLFTQKEDPSTRFLAGAIAGIFATTLTYPFDVLRVRMAAHWAIEPKYASTLAGLRHTIAADGLWSFSAGLRTALIGIAPFVGINFAIYESCKPYLGPDPSFEYRLGLGAASALVAQTFTYPLHILSRRLQVQDILTHGGPLYGGVTSALRHIYQTEGAFQGLYKGMRLTWMLGAVSVGISFSVNDIVRSSLLRYKRTVHQDYVSIMESLVGRK
eukprot:PhF_6_TR1080/c0_g1_i1/m.2315/K15085/SLC25A42; solute carrier family 25, member 42